MARVNSKKREAILDDQEVTPQGGASEAPSETTPSEATGDLSDFSELFKLVRNAKDEDIKIAVATHLNKLAEKHGLGKYRVLYLFDPETSINSYHSNRIYEAASSDAQSLDILLVVQSSGGHIEPAYLISKTCKKLSKNRFIVVVPRRAKSAATLLALGADEIHMGLMSELGPIDPQINGYPALGLTNVTCPIFSTTSSEADC